MQNGDRGVFAECGQALCHFPVRFLSPCAYGHAAEICPVYMKSDGGGGADVTYHGATAILHSGFIIDLSILLKHIC